MKHALLLLPLATLTACYEPPKPDPTGSSTSESPSSGAATTGSTGTTGAQSTSEGTETSAEPTSSTATTVADTDISSGSSCSSSSSSSSDSSSTTEVFDECLPPHDQPCIAEVFEPLNDHVNGTVPECGFTPELYVVEFDWNTNGAQTYLGVAFDLPCPENAFDGTLTIESDTTAGQLVCGVTNQDGGDYGNPKAPETTLLNFDGSPTSTSLALDPNILPSGAYKLVCFSAVERTATVSISMD